MVGNAVYENGKVMEGKKIEISMLKIRMFLKSIATLRLVKLLLPH